MIIIKMIKVFDYLAINDEVRTMFLRLSYISYTPLTQWNFNFQITLIDDYNHESCLSYQQIPKFVGAMPAGDYLTAIMGQQLVFKNALPAIYSVKKQCQKNFIKNSLQRIIANHEICATLAARRVIPCYVPLVFPATCGLSFGVRTT